MGGGKKGRELPAQPPAPAPEGVYRAWGEVGARLGCRTVAKGMGGRGWQGGGGYAWTLSEAPPLWGSLVLDPGEADWLGPFTTHPPPHDYTSSTRALSPQHPPLLFGQVPVPGLAPGRGKWGPQLTSSEGSGMSDAPCAPA